MFWLIQRNTASYNQLNLLEIITSITTATGNAVQVFPFNLWTKQTPSPTHTHSHSYCLPNIENMQTKFLWVLTDVWHEPFGKHCHSDFRTLGRIPKIFLRATDTISKDTFLSTYMFTLNPHGLCWHCPKFYKPITSNRASEVKLRLGWMAWFRAEGYLDPLTWIWLHETNENDKIRAMKNMVTSTVKNNLKLEIFGDFSTRL